MHSRGHSLNASKRGLYDNNIYGLSSGESQMSMRSQRSNASGIQQIRQNELAQRKAQEAAQGKKLADMEALYAEMASGKKSRFARAKPQYPPNLAPIVGLSRAIAKGGELNSRLQKIIYDDSSVASSQDEMLNNSSPSVMRRSWEPAAHKYPNPVLSTIGEESVRMPPSTMINLGKSQFKEKIQTGRNLSDRTLNLYEIREIQAPKAAKSKKKIRTEPIFRNDERDRWQPPENFEQMQEVRKRTTNYWKNRVYREFKPTVDIKKQAEMELIKAQTRHVPRQRFHRVGLDQLVNKSM